MFKIQIKNSTQDASFEHFEGKLFGGRAPSGVGKKKEKKQTKN